MSQIHVRDAQGRPVSHINIRLALGDLPSEAAYDDRFTDLAGNTAWPNPLASLRGYTLYVNDTNVDSRFGTVTHAVPTLGDDILIELPAARTPERARVVGQRFYVGEAPWFLKGLTAFPIFQQFLDGQDIRSFLQQAEGLGANCVRVFGMFHWINVNEFGKPAFKPQNYGDRFYDETPAFCRLCAEYGLRVYWSCFPDNAEVMPLHADRRKHYDRWVPILEAEPNTLFELTNEQDAHSFNAVDAKLYPKPPRMASCAGSYGDTGGSFPPPYWDFFDFHTPRSYPKAIKDCCVADAPDFQAGKAILLGEPDRYGSNGNPNAEQARMSAGTSIGTALGIVFHSRQGLRGELFDAVTLRCAAAFFSAIKGA